MSKQKRKHRSPRRREQVRLDCPHCGKSVVVRELARFQTTVPCPACHIPIAREFVEAAHAEYEAETAEGNESTDEAAPEGETP